MVWGLELGSLILAKGSGSCTPITPCRLFYMLAATLFAAPRPARQASCHGGDYAAPFACQCSSNNNKYPVIRKRKRWDRIVKGKEEHSASSYLAAAGGGKGNGGLSPTHRQRQQSSFLLMCFKKFDETLFIFDMCFNGIGVATVLFLNNNLYKRQQMLSLHFINQ